MGHASIVDDGLGLPNSSRTAEVTALIGFHVVRVRSHGVMFWVGTMALERNRIGNRTSSGQRRGRVRSGRPG